MDFDTILKEAAELAAERTPDQDGVPNSVFKLLEKKIDEVCREYNEAIFFISDSGLGPFFHAPREEGPVEKFKRLKEELQYELEIKSNALKFIDKAGLTEKFKSYRSNSNNQ